MKWFGLIYQSLLSETPGRASFGAAFTTTWWWGLGDRLTLKLLRYSPKSVKSCARPNWVILVYNTCFSQSFLHFHTVISSLLPTNAPSPSSAFSASVGLLVDYP